jgi:hypothetical protein
MQADKEYIKAPSQMAKSKISGYDGAVALDAIGNLVP